ncbi:MAG: divalent-cation tolerance protein CutA [Verrucomicrobia bacterium]|nr:MAG: divalent-cation tolerance protein CutA [Verrucomicrobiota bacterium]
MDLPKISSGSCMIRLVLTTFPDVEQAKQVTRQLVNGKLAACGTILPAATSIYIWEGVQEEASECLLLLKTSADRAQDLQTELLKLHPYEVPEIVSIATDSCHHPYAEWVLRQCKEV